MDHTTDPISAQLWREERLRYTLAAVSPHLWANDLQASIARVGLPVFALIPPNNDENVPKQYSRDDVWTPNPLF